MPKIRILVVAHDVVMCRLVAEALGRDPQLEVVATAVDGRIGIQRIPQVNPDIVTLDAEMPDFDAAATVKEIRKTYPHLPILIISNASQPGNAGTLNALGAGANDHVPKPSTTGRMLDDIKELESGLVLKIKALCPLIMASKTVPVGHAFGAGRRPSASVPAVVCIGASTGGPAALAEVIAGFQERLRVPVVIVQHMPPMFTTMLAERLDKVSPMPCFEAEDRQLVEAGCMYMAPGGRHMEVFREAGVVRIRLQDGPPENSCRPAVDVLFRSVAAIYGSGILAVIMTGMGQDGKRGCEVIRESGGHIIAQDQASSVVWGMPGVVVKAGMADVVLPLSEIASEITRRVQVRPASSMPSRPT